MASGNPVINYKALEIETLGLTVPELRKNRRFSYVSNKGNGLYVQTPMMTVLEVNETPNTVQGWDGELITTLSSQSPFVSTLHNLDEHFKSVIDNKANAFFGPRKAITRKVIDAGYIATLKTPEDGAASTISLKVVNPDQLLIRDQRDAVRQFSDIKPGVRIIAVMHIEGVAYTKTTISLDVVVRQVKVYIDDSIPWSIVNTDLDEDEEPVAEPDEMTIDVNEAERQVEALELAKLSIEAPDHIKEAHELLTETENKIEADENEPLNDTTATVSGNAHCADDDKTFF